MLEFYPIYINTKDFPDKVVCRRFTTNEKGEVSYDKDILFEGKTVEEVREKIQEEFPSLVSVPDPDPCIAEVWM